MCSKISEEHQKEAINKNMFFDCPKSIKCVIFAFLNPSINSKKCVVQAVVPPLSSETREGGIKNVSEMSLEKLGMSVAVSRGHTQSSLSMEGQSWVDVASC